MPLVYVTLAEGTTSQDQRAQIGDGIHRALVDVANAPEDDRFQVINEVPSTNLILVKKLLTTSAAASALAKILEPATT